MARKLYICCYDVSDDAIRYRVMKIVKSFSCGGQKSAYECFLSAGEYRLLSEWIYELLEPSDNMVLQAVMNPKQVQVLGKALKPIDVGFKYVG